MKNNTKQIEKFLHQFSQLEAIPFEVRRNFLKKISQKGGIDIHSQKELEAIFSYYSGLNDAKIERQKSKWFMISRSLKIQSVPKLSLKEKIISHAKFSMMDKVKRFKKYFQCHEKSEMKKAETAEDMENASQIARLKSSLLS